MHAIISWFFFSFAIRLELRVNRVKNFVNSHENNFSSFFINKKYFYSTKTAHNKACTIKCLKVFDHKRLIAKLFRGRINLEAFVLNLHWSRIKRRLTKAIRKRINGNTQSYGVLCGLKNSARFKTLFCFFIIVYVGKYPKIFWYK